MQQLAIKVSVLAFTGVRCVLLRLLEVVRDVEKLAGTLPFIGLAG